MYKPFNQELKQNLYFNLLPSSITLPKGEPLFYLLALIPSSISNNENHYTQNAEKKTNSLGIGELN